MPRHRITDIHFERRYFGWRCVIGFTFPTAKQFTHEYHQVEAVERWWLSAYLTARHEVRIHLEIHGAKPGERKAKGWPG
jgi:hypothetical protein